MSSLCPASCAVPSAGQIGGANGYAALNGMMNNAMAMKNTMVSPATFCIVSFPVCVVAAV
jgi:hypothetical protein